MTEPYDLYARLPGVLQNMACSLEGWRLWRRRYGRGFREILQEVEARARWSPEQWERFRDARLAAFVREVAAKSPFYQRRFREAGLDPSQVRGLHDLARLPILTKSEVKQHLQEIAPRGLALGPCIEVHTSGTTGSGLRFTATLAAEREQWAVWWRYRRWHGINLQTWCGYFGGQAIVPATQRKPPFWRVSYPSRQILFSAHHMSSANMPAYVGELRRRQPPWLHGYPSLIALAAAYLLDSGENLGYQVCWITTGAENLLPGQAELIQRAFGVKPRQHYGMAEAVANFSECEHGSVHVDEDFAAVEFLASGNGVYRVIGTNLSNPATPLVRYDTGDLATLADRPCPCGRPGRIVECVDGRQEDYVVLRNGARVGRMDHIFKDMVNVREAQIYQARPGELVYRIVRGPAYSAEDEQRLLYQTRLLRLGDDVTLRFEYPDRLERTASGKLRFVVSEIPEAQLVRQAADRM
jgi:phenylacetate-CoA ligase